MTGSRLLIVADRGTLKVYELERVPLRGWVVRLLEENAFTEVHKKFRERFTDQAGAFPAKGLAGRATGVAEQHGIKSEGDARLFKRIGQLASDALAKHQPKRWFFAAAPEINPGILEHVAPQWRDRLMRNVESDLVKIPPQTILQHFE
jgi:hypothetical protein